jgi:hypothetical protein
MMAAFISSKASNVAYWAQTRSAGMSAIPPLLGDKRTSRGEPISVAIDPFETYRAQDSPTAN